MRFWQENECRFASRLFGGECPMRIRCQNLPHATHLWSRLTTTSRAENYHRRMAYTDVHTSRDGTEAVWGCKAAPAVPPVPSMHRALVKR